MSHASWQGSKYKKWMLVEKGHQSFGNYLEDTTCFQKDLKRNMAAERFMGKSGLLILALCALLSLQGAEAQNCTYNGTPGWAIAVLVMLAILLASLLLSCCLAPLCTGMCRRDDSCQGGISFGK